jgi:hypothetical protein
MFTSDVANLSETEHARILRADEHSIGYDVIVEIMDELQSAAETRDYIKAREPLM